MAFFICGLTLVLIAVPEQALAWGIGIHLQIGSQILANPQALPGPLQALLAAHAQDFLYGCISADITLGKKFTHYLNHCHSWGVGKRVLAAARTDAQRACAYGYISHLAADTVAHSYFVPYKLIRTFNTTMLNHAYWELRFEAGVAPEVWALARGVGRKRFPEHDAMLRSVLSDTIFSFSTNKRLFNSLLLLNRLQHWQKMLRSLSTASKWDLPQEEFDEYYGLALQISEGILAEMDQSPFWKADPTGERAINAAKMIRKNLNLLWLDGKLSTAEATGILQEIKPRLREGICQPDRILELLSTY